MDGAISTGRKYPGYTLAQLEATVAEGRGTDLMVREIAARKAGSAAFKVPQIKGGTAPLTAREKLESKVEGFDVPMLKELARKAMHDTRAECDVILSLIMDELEKRLPEAEFVAFSDSL